MSNENSAQKSKLNRHGFVWFIQIFVVTSICAAAAFISAGRLDWLEAWLYFAIFVVVGSIGSLCVLLRDPGVFNARGQIGKDTRLWDRVVLMFFFSFYLAIYVVPGLDTRFGWSVMPLAVKIAGGIGLVLSLALIFRVMTANTFLSANVRIQGERAHHGVTTGPYRFVRHPMYAGIVIMLLSTPLVLGSWWGLIPSLLIGVVLIVRTILEEKTLYTELIGYPEYVQKVRYRLIPGVW